MEEGLNAIVRSLRQDPHALETVYLSVIAFAGVARTIAPLVDVVSFYPPKLPVGSGTSLGAALRELMRQIDTSVTRTTAEQKGDWKPVVYLFTDGKPTDDVASAIADWQEKYTNRAILIAVALGKYADLTVLRRLTETVLLFEESEEGDFRKFISWVTATVVAQSKSAGENRQAGAEVAGHDCKVITLFKKDEQPPPPPSDHDCVVLVGRCQKSRNPYLMKYDRLAHIVPLRQEVKADHFQLAGCFPITEEYFDWSAPEAENLVVNTGELVGAPGCPWCGNITAFAMCNCGKLMCLNGPGVVTCPWCQTSIEFTPEGGGGFDVHRGRG
jgi:uncharacterized protein YegL